MGPGETMALFAVVGLVIAVLVTIGTMFRRIMIYKERQLGTTADATAEKAAQYGAHVERLEERVRVLERIATAKGADLAPEIEGLRDVERPAALQRKEPV